MKNSSSFISGKEFVKRQKLSPGTVVSFECLFRQDIIKCVFILFFIQRHQKLKEQVDKCKVYEAYMMKILDFLPEGNFFFYML